MIVIVQFRYFKVHSSPYKGRYFAVKVAEVAVIRGWLRLGLRHVLILCIYIHSAGALEQTSRYFEL